MAERSFAKEVRDLELGEGQEFRGEGILALTKALLQSGVGYVGGYQGAPISHLMDVLSDAQELLGKLGVQFSVSASEASAAASLAASGEVIRSGAGGGEGVGVGRKDRGAVSLAFLNSARTDSAVTPSRDAVRWA